MPYAVNGNTRLYWEAHGSGPAVLLIMGLSFTHEMWYRVLPHLQGRYRAIVFDNRGMGRSDCPRGPYSIRQMAADAVEVLNAAGLRKAHTIGASMGGMIAQELALTYPERVESLVLGCTTYSGLLGKWPEFRRGPHWGRWSRATRLERERSLRELLYASETPLERIEEDWAVRCRCAWSYKGFLNQFAGILMWNAYRRLPRIQAPTLVLHGEEDHLVPAENGRVIASRIPGARFVLLPKAGHILITDQPELSTKLLLEFLAEVAG
ncbi:MAG: alpha/beta fold hydrolase [Acidobacteriaceae bacterium]|nr:alpha/beta fold hydrolase [Acidobacteriaceae bacterium]